MSALEQQTFDHNAFEVVVVDDGSTDDTEETLRWLAAATSLQLTVIRVDPNGGQANGRNVGWRSTDAPIIAFTDDDCTPQPGWLEALVRGFDDEAVSIVQGRTKPDPGQWPPSSQFDHWRDIDGPSPWFEAANVAYRRDLLDVLDGFDVTYRNFCEDADLALRGIEGGARTTYAPGALVWHDVVPRTWAEALRGTSRHVEVVRLAAEHPQVRAQFTHPFAYDKAHVTALGILGSAALALARPRWVTPWLVLGWWSRRYLDQRPFQIYGPPTDRARRFAEWLAIDATEMAHLVRASARYKSFLM